MNDPDNFLSRWSRRKREAESQPEADGKATPDSVRDTAHNADARHSATSPAPEFDVSKLPPIESIGAGTDITAFMQTGVPSALRHAALRRAWSADPNIRNFIGPNENFWDAAGPEGIPGFGDLDPGLDVKRMVAELFGEAKSEPKESDAAVDRGAVAENLAKSDESGVTPAASMNGTDEDTSSPQADNAAAQHEPPEPEAAKKIERRHGGAMPQ